MEFDKEENNEVRFAALKALFDAAAVLGCGALDTNRTPDENFNFLLKGLKDEEDAEYRQTIIEGISKLLLHGADTTEQMMLVGTSLLLTVLACYEKGTKVAMEHEKIVSILFSELKRPDVLCSSVLSTLRYLFFTGTSLKDEEWLINYGWRLCVGVLPESAGDRFGLSIKFQDPHSFFLFLMLCEILTDIYGVEGVIIPKLIWAKISLLMKSSLDPVLLFSSGTY